MRKFPSEKETFIYILNLIKNMKEIFKRIIKDFHEKKSIKTTKRNINIPTNSKKIITIIGPRRSGKTYLLYQTINELSKTIHKEKIIYINFEDERLNVKKENFQEIIDAYLELYPNNQLEEVYFFFDEIQETQGWEKFIRRLYDQISKKIFLTGSSAKLLSKEIASSLRGRTLNFEVFPLSFKEFLEFKKIDYKNIYSTTNLAKIKTEFETFLTKGGFPETIDQEEDIQNKILQNYFDVMIYRDIIERYEISNTQLLKRFIIKAISNIGKEFSKNKTYNELKSEGFKTSKDSIYKFPNYTEDIYLLFFISKFENSFNKQETSLKKIYAIDSGLINAITYSISEDEGRLLENTVFIELKRQNKRIFYHKEKAECDFLIVEKNKVTEAIQVTKEINESNKDRELKGLIEAMNKFKLKEGLILTNDQETIIKKDNKTIKVKPTWKWLIK